MFAPVASFLGSLSSFFKNFDAFRSALQAAQSLAPTPATNTLCQRTNCNYNKLIWRRWQTDSQYSEPFRVKYSVHDLSRTGSQRLLCSARLCRTQPAAALAYSAVSCKLSFCLVPKHLLRHNSGAMLHNCVQTTLKIVNHHDASQCPGASPDGLCSESAKQARSGVALSEQGESTVMVLTCVPGPFAEYQDRKQGLLVGWGSCQL